MDFPIFRQEGRVSTPYRRIGAGFCGSVWSDHGDVGTHSTAIKRDDGGPGRSLANDFNIHTQLLRAYQCCPQHITASFLIPKCYEFVPKDYVGWDASHVLDRFPEGYSACNVLITQRIPPVPEEVRHKLIDKYCPLALIPTIKADTNNNDCLIRPYLGRRKVGQRESRLRVFNLRNYPLYIDQMEDLGLDIPKYATAMAQALAFMHWSARIDANDVEFVLAPLPGTDFKEAQFQSPQLGGHNLWILDFDCCRKMDMTTEGVQLAAQAFLRNDPFYPRPGRSLDEDRQTWNCFKRAFLEASSTIIQADTEIPQDLPELLMKAIEQLVEEQKNGPKQVRCRCNCCSHPSRLNAAKVRKPTDGLQCCNPNEVANFDK